MADARDQSPDAEAAHEAAEKAVDETALLDGEDPTTRHPEDADHWIAAYRELIAFKETLLETGSKEIRDMTNANAQHEANDVDVTLLNAQLQRYRRRLDFWTRRREELQRSA